MTAWDACTLEPNQALRWIECHTGTAAWVQAAFTVLAIATAFAAPAYIQWRAARERRRVASVETALRLQRWIRQTKFKLLSVDGWDASNEPEPDLDLPAVPFSDRPSALAELPAELAHPLIKFQESVESILSEASTTTFYEDSVDAHPAFLRRSAALALEVADLMVAASRIGDRPIEPLDKDDRERFERLIVSNRPPAETGDSP